MSVIAIIAILALIGFLLKYVFNIVGQNPFANDTREPLKALADHKDKNKVLKQGFLPSRIPENLDAIVIGSGIGGLGLAVLLAKVGKRVLVLEQHDRAGGCCHTFTEKGFEFDVGIHYVGELRKHCHFRCIVDQCTNGQLQWEPLDNPFDMVVIGPPDNRRSYPIYSGHQRFAKELKKCFPGEEKAIDEYLRLFKRAGQGAWAVVLLKLLPAPMAKFLVHSGLATRFFGFFSLASQSVSDVVKGLTDNTDLRAVFSYIWGDYGTLPKEGSFATHSILMEHYAGGAWYPKGGSSEIAYHMIPIIQQAGGAVLVRAPVNRILFNEASEAIGVSVLKGREEVHIHAPIVVSDAGIFNTYQKLLPKELQTKPEIQFQLSRLKNGMGALSIFLGLNGTKEELGLKAQNSWCFRESNIDDLVTNYLSLDRDQSVKNVPLFFMSSSSAKDPTWGQKNPGKSTLTIIGFAKYEWFEEWENDKVTNRGQDYKELKDALIQSALELVYQLYPKVKGRVEFVEAGTPLTHKHYLGSPKGEVYGADHTVTRYSPEASFLIRPQTPLKNLYLTGQDVFFCGFTGAMSGAVVCASALLDRNLYLDATILSQKLKYFDSRKTALQRHNQTKLE